MGQKVKAKPAPPPPGRKNCTPRPQTRKEWRDALIAAGYPTTVVVLDFETYFDEDYSLKKMSTIEYIQDDRFEALGLACLEMNQPFKDYENATHFWANVGEHLEYLQRQYGDNLQNCTVVAQNARFDLGILRYRYNLVPDYFIDTRGLAQHWNARAKNGVADLCKRHNLPAKGDTLEFKGLTRRRRYFQPKSRRKQKPLPQRRPMLTDEWWVKLSEYACNDVVREWEIFCIYVARLSTPEVELPVQQHTLNLWFKPRIAIDTGKAGELKRQMDEAIDKAVAETGCTRGEISGERSFENLLIGELGDEYQSYTKPAKNKKGWKLAIAKADPEREMLETHSNERVRQLMAAKNAMSSWPGHIKRINRFIDQAKAAGGLLPMPLIYYGGHTGRWSGTEKLNPQNLGSRGHPLVNAVRHILIAPEGQTLVIADASQIEARVLAWIAGQWDLVEQFANGEPIYCRFAEKVLGRRVRKPKAGGIPEVEAAHKQARNEVGKVGILGCGYGMGASKMSTQYGTDPTLAESIVNTYRKEHEKITRFWRDIEGAFRYTAKYKRECALPRGLWFHSEEGCDVIITLPSGRECKYHNVRVRPGGYGDEITVFNHREKKWDHFWGGHLTENVVQAMSRDILWYGIDGMEQDGYPVALHCHDELIACVPEDDGEQALGRAIGHLSTRPSWGPDLPLAAEGVVSKRYGEH